MMRQIVFISIYTLGFLPFVLGQESGQKNRFRQNLYAAFGSPSLYASLNYEINVLEKSGFTILSRVGAGFNFFQPSIGEEWNFNTGVTGLYGKKRSKIEISLGLVYQLYQSYSYTQEKDTTKYKPIIYSGLGYRYQPEKGVMFKFMMTPTFTINPNNWVFFPYTEIGLGCSIGHK